MSWKVHEHWHTEAGLQVFALAESLGMDLEQLVKNVKRLDLNAAETLQQLQIIERSEAQALDALHALGFER